MEDDDFVRGDLQPLVKTTYVENDPLPPGGSMVVGSGLLGETSCAWRYRGGHEADRSGGDLAPLCAQGRAQFVAIAARRLDRDDRGGNAVAHYTARASRPLAS
jgi:hypothetical protein